MLFRSLTGFKWVCALSLVVMTTACGGGGGTSTTTATSTTAPPATPAAATSPATVPTPATPSATITELAINPQFSQGLAFWSVSDGVLTPSLLRAGGQALDLGWKAVQPLSSSVMVPGRSYTLKIKARLANAGQASTASINFHLANGWEVFRTYKVAIDSSAFKDYEINFTAPNYVGKADITLVTGGTRTLIDSTSLTMRATISQTEPITSQQGSHVPANYQLAFNDEFNGTSLNRQKWFTRFIQAGGTLDTLNDELQRYTDNNTHMVANGVLSLTARQVASNTNAGLPYESGMIRSDWTARYGYYEARVKMPGGLGVWPAFWLNSDASDTGRLSWPPEIDIFEFVNNGVEDTTRMLHSGISASPLYPSAYQYADPAFDKMWTFWAAPFHFHEGWHTVGAEWTPESVTLYIDGMKIYTRTHSWTYSDGALAGPAHIILNLAIGGQWAGRHGIDNTAFPQALQIDWVRAYRRVSP